MKIEINDDEIDVQEIMKQIKLKAAGRNYNNDLLEDAAQLEKRIGFNMSGVEEYQLLLNRTWYTAAPQHIFSHRKVVGPLIIFFKKIIRKSLYWYINPIMERQSEFNANVVRGYNELVSQMKYIEEYINSVEKPESKNE